jgi:hypothetical protein
MTLAPMKHEALAVGLPPGILAWSTPDTAQAQALAKAYMVDHAPRGAEPTPGHPTGHLAMKELAL